MASLEPESRNLRALLSSEITKIMKEASTVPVYKDSVLQSHLLQKARMRIRLQLNACVSQSEPAGHSSALVTQYEIRRASLTISHAITNPYYVTWDVDRYADMVKSSYGQPDGAPSTEQKKLSKYFPMAVLGRISEPATIVDNHGKILVWYLPNILSCSRVDLMNTATTELHDYLLKSIPVTESAIDKKHSWRSDNFLVPEGGGKFGAGRVTMSPAYFMQRRQRLQDPLVPSASYSAKSVQHWLKAISGTEFFFNAITAIIAPELFEAGSAAVSKVLNVTRQPKKPVPVSEWPSIFTGMELIANRITLSHRDAGGARSHYDLLASLGIGHDATFSIKDLDAELDYFPGTLAFIAGKVLEHSVGPWKIGERFVVAHFMKDKVHDRVGVSKPAFPVQMDLLQLLGSSVTDHRPRKRVRREI